MRQIITFHNFTPGSPIIVPFIVYSGVHAGFPSPAMDYLERGIDLNQLLIKNPSSTFIIDVRGDSMVDAFIPQSCRLIVDRSETVCNNDIILARIDGEYTVKRFVKSGNMVALYACNKKKNYPAIIIHPETDFEVFGVVTTVLVDTREAGFYDRIS